MRSLRVLLAVGAMLGFLATCTPFVPSQNPYSLLSTLPGETPSDSDTDFFNILADLFDVVPEAITPPGIANPTFRPLLDIVLENNSGAQLVETKIAAWIKESSLPEDEEARGVAEGELRGDGWVRQEEDQVFGRVTIEGPVYVYRRGLATGGATIDLKIAAANTNLADLRDSIGVVIVPRLTFVTPDGFLLFYDSPDSCESIAFLYTQNGIPLQGPSDFGGGQKVLRQVQGYQCDPFMPGFFLDEGGTREANEYAEGDFVNIRFSAGASGDGDFAEVIVLNR